MFLKGPSLYAFKGLAGRFAPIGVHLAMLLIMVGATLSASGSFRGSVTVPQGLNFVIGDVLGPSGFLSTPTEAFNTEVHVNRFYMDYYDSGEVIVVFVHVKGRIRRNASQEVQCCIDKYCSSSSSLSECSDRYNATSAIYRDKWFL